MSNNSDAENGALLKQVRRAVNALITPLLLVLVIWFLNRFVDDVDSMDKKLDLMDKKFNQTMIMIQSTQSANDQRLNALDKRMERMEDWKEKHIEKTK